LKPDDIIIRKDSIMENGTNKLEAHYIGKKKKEGGIEKS